MVTLRVFSAFLRRDLQTDLSYRAALTLELVGVFFTLASFYYIGKLVDDTDFAQHGLRGGYFGYVVVGLALVQIVQVSFTSFARKLRDEQTTGTFEALLATPTSPSVIVLASAAYDLIRATLAGVFLIVASVILFGLALDATFVSLLAALAALAGCILLFAALGVAIAAFTVVFKRGQGALSLAVTGLALLGGVYFPVEVLPGALEVIAKGLPFTWGVDVARDGLLGRDVDLPRLGGLFASAAVLLPVTLALFGAAVRKAQRAGTLAQY